MINNDIIKVTATGTIIAGISGDSYEDRAKIVNARNAADSLDKTYSNGDVFEFIGVIISDGINEKTETPCKDTFLIQRDGSALFSKSDGIYRAVKSIIEDEIFATYLNDGIWVKLLEIKTNGGNTMKSLMVVPPQA